MDVRYTFWFDQSVSIDGSLLAGKQNCRKWKFENTLTFLDLPFRVRDEQKKKDLPDLQSSIQIMAKAKQQPWSLSQAPLNLVLGSCHGQGRLNLKLTIYPLDPAAFPAMLQDRRSVHPAGRWQAFHWSEAHQVRLDGPYLYSQSTRFTRRQFLSESNFHFHHQSGPAGNSSSAGRARKWLAESLARQNQSDKPGKGRHLTTSQKRTNGPTMICGTVCSFFWCSYLVFIFYISFLRLFFRVCFWMSIFDELPTTNPVSWSGLVKDHGLMIAIVLLVFFA